MARKTASTTKATPRKKTSTARKEAPATSKKLQKPMFPMGTWITVLLLAVLIGFAFYLNRKKETTAAQVTPTSGTTAIFDSTNGVISSIEIKSADGATMRVARNEKNIWAVELPTKAEANQGSAEAAATQASALQIISPIDGKPSIFGLDNPAYTITIGFANGKKHVLEVGDSTPTKSGYYVRVDNNKMLITDLSGIDALLQLVSSPPYLNTPVPTSLPATETPVSPAEATVTPTP